MGRTLIENTMATEYVIWPFLNAKGKLTKVGDKAPDEAADNLSIYRDAGLIGIEAKAEAVSGKDVGRPGKATTRKTGKAAS